MPQSASIAADKFHQLALTKMTRVLGAQRGHRLMQQILESLRIELQGPDELLRFAAELSKLGGFEGALGAMLSVQAVMNGASSAPDPDPDPHRRATGSRP